MVHDNLRNPALLGGAPLALFGLDEEGRICRWTPPALSEFGFRPETIRELPFAELLPDEERDLLKEVQPFVPGEPPLSRQLQLILEAGPVDVTLRAGRLTDNPDGIAVLVSICRITQRENRPSVSVPHISFEDLPGNDAVILVERLTPSILVPVYLNAIFERRSGITIEQVQGCRSNFFGGLQAKNEVFDEIAKRLSKGNRYHGTVLLTRNDGTTLWAEVNVAVLEGEPNDRDLVMTTLRDVTGFRRREAQLERALETARKVRVEREQFLASMSHEIRTPMSGILGMAQLLGQTGLNEQQREYLETIEQAASGLTNLLDDIQFYSDLDSNRVRLERSPFRPVESLHRVVQLFRSEAEQKGVELLFEPDASLPERVLGDGVRFEQIVMQLLGNAVKFTDEGRIRLSVESIDDPVGLIRFRVVVEDTGIGIAEEFRPSVFESFVKESEMIAKHSGSGLGLPIIRKLTGLMDGTIELESRRGEGTRVVLELPFEPEERLGVTGDETARPGTRKGKELDGVTLLLAEDHPVNQELVKGLLGREGAEVIIAEDGSQALEMLRNRPGIDLVLMDIHMPVMNGVEATRRIRSELERPQSGVPVIALTASVMNSDIALYRKSGMNDVLAKPFTRESLIRIVRNGLEGEFGEISAVPAEVSGDGPEAKNVVDMVELSEMVAGDRAMLLELLDLFLEQTPELRDDLLHALEEKRWADLAATAHKLKPTLRYVGMEEGYRACLELERLREAAPANIEEADERTRYLAGLITRALEEIRTAADGIRREVSPE